MTRNVFSLDLKLKVQGSIEPRFGSTTLTGYILKMWYYSSSPSSWLSSSFFSHSRYSWDFFSKALFFGLGLSIQE
jgi:hypothetical protein